MRRNVNIRLSEEELAHLRRWDQDRAGVGAVVRRLIREEVEREQQQEVASRRLRRRMTI